MVTEQDRVLLESLTRLNMAITTFSMNLVARNVDHEAHIGMALMLLDSADQTLQHLLNPEHSHAQQPE